MMPLVRCSLEVFQLYLASLAFLTKLFPLQILRVVKHAEELTCSVHNITCSYKWVNNPFHLLNNTKLHFFPLANCYCIRKVKHLWAVMDGNVTPGCVTPPQHDHFSVTAHDLKCPRRIPLSSFPKMCIKKKPNVFSSAHQQLGYYKDY